MVAPTREIAIQIRDVIRNLAKYTSTIHCEAFIGGTAHHMDVKRLKNCQIVVGTPGNIIWKRAIILRERIDMSFI